MQEQTQLVLIYTPIPLHGGGDPQATVVEVVVVVVTGVEGGNMVVVVVVNIVVPTYGTVAVGARGFGLFLLLYISLKPSTRAVIRRAPKSGNKN